MVIIAKNSTNNPKYLKVDTADASVAKNQEAQLVICLNYVWDSVNEIWVPMTQP